MAIATTPGGPKLVSLPHAKPFGAKIIDGYNGIFRFAGKGVGAVSTIPFVGYATRIPMAGLRSFVEGHDTMFEQIMAKRLAKDPSKAKEIGEKVLSRQERDAIQDAAKGGKLNPAT